MCNYGLMDAAVFSAFLAILAPASETTKGLTAGIRRMPFLLQRLLGSPRSRK